MDDVVAAAQQDPQDVQPSRGLDARLAGGVRGADEEADLDAQVLELGGDREGLSAGSRQLEPLLRVSRVTDHQGAQRPVRESLGHHA